MIRFRLTLFAALALPACFASAQPVTASTPYVPSWSARHQLTLLVDHAGLPLPLSHWPLPIAAVQEALDQLPRQLPSSPVDLAQARAMVQRELQQRQQTGQLTVHIRNRAESLPGFGDLATPGSSVHLSGAERRLDRLGDLAGLSVAAQWGVRVEETSNSLATTPSGWGTDGRHQVRLDGTAAALGWAGWQVQAFSHRYWWSPGWQSSLVNGSNAPAWNGLGVQRSTTRPSESPWLRWMGPWNLDVFVAQAQDPIVVPNQPRGYHFSGMRLTMRPQPWLEVGFSRALQAGGTGRPSGAENFIKAFFGQEVNQNPGDPPDTSSQIAGYDARLRCPQSWGQCAAYAQWMGEDAAGKVPLPFKFMALWGIEHTYAQGRFRVFAEYANTDAYSLPWDHKDQFPGYTNGVYSQGYTHGGRWIGSAQGGGSEVTTLGWMDAQRQRMVKVHVGKVLWSVGAGFPGVNAPRGDLIGLTAMQTLQWRGLTWSPELSWVHLSEGQSTGENRKDNLRIGLSVRAPL